VKHIDVLDLSDDARDLIRECEAKGEQTVFERNGRAVAMLVSYDEYLALRETIEIANDALLFATLAERDSIEPEPTGRRLHFVMQNDLDSLSDEDKALADKAFERIEDDPIAGAPLFEPLKGLWSYRTGRLRIIYKIVAEARMVVILVIRSAA
jgi:mRNA-degrading endonuclease RelE of RelBE toxin-antitoxin system/PHD/YefM family antitoxin component YafN of YafNO toxin-antitoxin module